MKINFQRYYQVVLISFIVSLFVAGIAFLSSSAHSNTFVGTQSFDIQGLSVDGLFGLWSPASVAVDDEGAIHIVVEGRGAEGAGIYYVKVKNQRTEVLERLSLANSWALNPDIQLVDGAVHVVWQGKHSGKERIYYRRQVGDNWDPVQQVSNSNIGARFPNFVLVDQKDLYIEWIETSRGLRRINRCRWQDNACMTTTRTWVSSTPSITIADPSMRSQSARTLAFLFEENLWTVKENGMDFSQLTTSGSVTSFAWSPDGQEIAYIMHDSNMDGDVYVMNVDGSNVRRLTVDVHASRWVIDWYGSRIAFLRNLDTYPMVRIAYVDVTDPYPEIVDISGDLENWGMGFGILNRPWLRWSPDGQWIVLSHGSATGVAASDGTSFIAGSFSNPAWKNDASHIIYPASPGIHFFDPHTMSYGQLSSVDANMAAYSPNDTYVAYVNDDYLARMNVNDTQHFTLAYGRAIEPNWSPQGDALLYASWDTGDMFPEYTGIHVINADGSAGLQIAGGYARQPVWQPEASTAGGGPTLIAAPTMIAADGSSTAVVTLSHAPAGHRVRILSNRGHVDTLKPLRGTTDISGTFTTTLSSFTSGTSMLTAQDLTTGQIFSTSARVWFTSEAVTFPPAPDTPADIVGVEAKLPLDARYFQGLEAINRIAITVAWKDGTPGSIEYSVNGQINSIPAISKGAVITNFNMSERLQPGVNILSFVAVNAQGKRSRPVTFSPRLMALPDWLRGLQTAAMLDKIVFVTVEDTTSFKMPKEPWKIGGGPLEIQGEFEGSAILSLRCEDVATLKFEGGAGLESEFKSIELGGKFDLSGEVVASVVDCWIPTAEGTVKAKMTFYGQKNWPVPSFFAEFINPAVAAELEKLVGVIGIGDKGLEVFGTVYVRGELSGFIESGVKIIPQDPYVEWQNYTIGFSVKPEAGYEFSSFGAEFKAYLALNGKAEQTIPTIRDFRLNKWDKLSFGGEAGYEFKPPLRQCKYERVFELNWTYKPQEDKWEQSVKPKISRDCGLFGRQYANNYATFEATPTSLQSFAMSMYPTQQGLNFSDLASQATVTSVLVSNVYTYTETALAVSANDDALLVWVHDDTTKQTDRSQELYFSFWNGLSWSVPSGLTDDVIMDGTPQISWTDSDHAMAIWSRLNEVLPLGASWDITTAQKIEIATAMYTASINTWSPVTLLTTNTALDLKPQLASNSAGNLLAAWRQNDAGLLGGDAASPDQIMTAFYDGAWSALATAVTDIPGLVDMAVGYGDNAATLAYTRYFTPTGYPTSTLQLFTVTWDGTTWLTPTQRTDDALHHHNPQIVYNEVNHPLIIWLAGDKLSLRNLNTGNTANLTLEDGAAIDQFRVVQEEAGNMVAIFTVQAAQRDLYLAFYDQAHNLWGRPRSLTNDRDAQVYPSVGLDSTGRLLMAYAARAVTSVTRTTTISSTGQVVTFTVPTEGETDLLTLSRVFTQNLTLDEGHLSISDDHPVPGSSVVLSATVRNSADLTLDGVMVGFYDGDPLSGGTLIQITNLSSPLPAGFTVTLTTTYNVPISGSARIFYAVADPTDLITESDESDNTISLMAFGPDLEIINAGVDYWGGRDVGLRTLIRNIGTSTAPTTTLAFYRDALTGTLSVTDTVRSLAAGETLTLTTPWNFGALAAGDYPLVAAVNQNDFIETFTVNNVYTFALEVRADVMVSPYYLWAASPTEATVSVTATVYNVGAVTATNVPVGFYGDDHLNEHTPLFTRTIPLLAPAGSTTLNGLITESLACTLYVYVDPRRTLTETTRANNLAVLSYQGMCYPIYLPVVLRGYAPVRAEFTASPTSGVIPLTVTFSNNATGAYTFSRWTFGDGAWLTIAESSSIQINPTHVYTAAGTYTVTLTISGVSGSDDEVKPNYITVDAPTVGLR